MRTADLVTAAVLMLLGGVVIFDSLRLGIGWGTDGPRSGFFPFWLAVLMTATSALIFVQALRRPVPRVLCPARRCGRSCPCWGRRPPWSSSCR